MFRTGVEPKHLTSVPATIPDSNSATEHLDCGGEQDILPTLNSLAGHTQVPSIEQVDRCRISSLSSVVKKKRQLVLKVPRRESNPALNRQPGIETTAFLLCQGGTSSFAWRVPKCCSSAHYSMTYQNIITCLVFSVLC